MADEVKALSIGEVLHALVDGIQGEGLDKEAAHKAVDDEYGPEPATEPAGDPNEGTVVSSEGKPPESEASTVAATPENPSGDTPGTV